MTSLSVKAVQTAAASFQTLRGKRSVNISATVPTTEVTNNDKEKEGNEHFESLVFCLYQDEAV